MSNACAKCGTSLAEGQSFCTACGTRAAERSGQRPKFCTKCGGPLPSDGKFCEKCGAPALAQQVPFPGSATTASPSFQPVVQSTAPVSATVSAVAPGKSSGGKVLKLLMIATAIFALGLIGVMGSCAYVAYRAKQRFNKVEQAYKKDDLGAMLAAAKGESDKPHPLPDWKPAPAELASSPQSKIPLRESLRLVNAGSDELRGDYESIFKVDKVTDKTVHIQASQQFPPGQGIERLLNNGTTNNKTRKIECGRTEFMADIANSAEFDAYFCREGRNEQHPGTTAMEFSRKTFSDLKATGKSDFTFHEDPLKAMLKSFKNVMTSDSQQSSEAATQDLMKKMMSFAPAGVVEPPKMDTPPLKGSLHINSTADLAFPVMINDQPAQLPVMDVAITAGDAEGHAYVLDNPEYPLVLATASSMSSGREQVIKIYWDVPKQLEQELEKNGRAQIYDLYFDFNSDVLRPESGKVLDEIAEVMHAHPDWKLRVEGYTDNIGGNASNLDLSKRRAHSVVSALAVRYLIPEKRFTSNGFGSSSPVDTNATPEGRARNRRVELVRQ